MLIGVTISIYYLSDTKLAFYIIH